MSHLIQPFRNWSNDNYCSNAIIPSKHNYAVSLYRPIFFTLNVMYNWIDKNGFELKIENKK